MPDPQSVQRERSHPAAAELDGSRAEPSGKDAPPAAVWRLARRSKRASWQTLLLFAILLGLAMIPQLHKINGPYSGHREINSAWMSTAARNYLVHGYAKLRFAVADSDGTVPTEWLRIYMGHSPLVPLMVSASFQVFGMHEWAARLVPILFTMASIVLIQRLGTALGGNLLGWVAAFVFAMMPMNAYFGRVVNYEPITLCFALGAALAYLHWVRGGGRRWPGAMLALFVLAALTDWPGYYLGLVLPAHYFLTARRPYDLRILLLPVLACLLFGVHLGHVSLVQGPKGLEKLANKFLYRAHLTDWPVEETGEFSATEFISVEARRAVKLFTLPVLVLAAVALFDSRRRSPADPNRDNWDPLFVVGLLALAAIHVLLFRHGAWIHDFWLLYFGAPLALLAARGALSLTTNETRTRTLIVLGTIFMLSSWQQLRALHQIYEPVVAMAELARQTSEPDDLIIANHLPMTTRNVAWHAVRYVHDEPVHTLRHLRSVIGDSPMRYFVYYRVENQPIAEDLTQWLETHGAITSIPPGEANIRETYRVSSDLARSNSEPTVAEPPD